MPWVTLEKENFPMPWWVVHNPTNGLTGISYSEGSQLRFSLHKNGKQAIPPAHYYQFGDHVISAPKRYGSDRYYTTMFKYEADYVQQGVLSGQSMKDIMKQVDELERLHGDKSAVYLYVIEFY